MEDNIKILAFEYLLTQLIEWGAEKKPAVPKSSFTRLKALKLLFFTAAVKNEEGGDLLDVFDNFYALPNGPVESDVYNSITSDQLAYYTFKDFSLGTKRQFSDSGLCDDIKARINLAIEVLKKKNGNLVSYRAEDLVALSHSWMSWQHSILIAKVLGKGSYRMDINKIRTNNQIFSI